MDIIKGVHLAATAEFKGFTEAMRLNAEQMHEIVSGAAGLNVQLKQYGPGPGMCGKPLMPGSWVGRW